MSRPACQHGVPLIYDCRDSVGDQVAPVMELIRRAAHQYHSGIYDPTDLAGPFDLERLMDESGGINLLAPSL